VSGIRFAVASMLLALAICAVPHVAYAAAPRPNALDRAVNAIPDATLLSHSARGLVDPDRESAARRYASLLLPGWFATIVLQIAALAYFWQSGSAARVRDWLRWRAGNKFALRFYFGTILALIARLAELLPDFYSYRVARIMSLSDELLRSWAVDWLVNTLVTMVLAGLVVAVALWLVDRTPLWYLYLIAAILVVNVGLAFVAPFVVLPHFGAYVPLSPNLQREVDRLEARSSVRLPVIEHVNDRTHLGYAYVTGLGPSARIIVADGLIEGSSRREVMYNIAQQLGYIRIGGEWRVVIGDAVFTVLGIAFAVGIADRIKFRRDDDPLARLALVVALLGVAFLIVVPLDNAMLRSLEEASERYAIAITHDRAAAVRSVVRMADQRLDDVCQSRMTSMYLGRLLDPARAVFIANGVESGCP
jgi:Zn-dependent protease with chaperone function